MGFHEAEGIMDAMIATDTVADANEDRSSCSCLEGAACAVPDACKDWEHRFEIAKRVRDESGFSDNVKRRAR